MCVCFQDSCTSPLEHMKTPPIDCLKFCKECKKTESLFSKLDALVSQELENQVYEFFHLKYKKANCQFIGVWKVIWRFVENWKAIWTTGFINAFELEWNSKHIPTSSIWFWVLASIWMISRSRKGKEENIDNGKLYYIITF